MKLEPGLTSLFETTLKLRAWVTRPYSDSYQSSAELIIEIDDAIESGCLVMPFSDKRLASWREANVQPPPTFMDFQSANSRQVASVMLTTLKRDSALVIQFNSSGDQLRILTSLLGEKLDRDEAFGRELLLSVLEALPMLSNLADQLDVRGVDRIEVQVPRELR